VAQIKQVFQTWPEQINHKYIMEAFLAEVVDVGDTVCIELAQPLYDIHWTHRLLRHGWQHSGSVACSRR
jgi:hypothetical protein